MPRHAVGLTGASQVAACTLAAGDTPRSGRSKDWLKFKNPDAPAVKHEAEEEWGHERRR
jgi:CTP:molybdopterin cytidylyltransferase MocA